MKIATENAEFSNPMQAWPSLAEYGQHFKLAKSGIELFLYGSAPSNKPALILIHGLGDDADTWRHVFTPLLATHRVVAPDLPGFGRSDKPRRIYSLVFLRDVIVELMDALSLNTAALLGNSLGAMIAEAVAIKHPMRVTNLVLVGGTLTAPIYSYNRALLFMALPIVGRLAYDGLRDKPQAAYESSRLFYANLDNLPVADRQFLYRRVNERVWDDNQRDAFFSILRQLVFCLPLRRGYFSSRLISLGVPTHLIWGEKDVIMPLETALALVGKQPRFKLTILPNVGHLPQQEDPEVFLRALQEYHYR